MVIAPKTVDALLCYRQQVASGLTTLRQVAFIVGVAAIPAASLEESLLDLNDDLVLEYKIHKQNSNNMNNTNLSTYYGSYSQKQHSNSGSNDKANSTSKRHLG